MGDVNVDDDAILKSFLAEVGEVERDKKVVRNTLETLRLICTFLPDIFDGSP
ncbi:unnamed protein product [Brassica oleracea]